MSTHTTSLADRRAATSRLRIAQSDLAGTPAAARFIGAEHGGMPVSLFLIDGGPGSGPRLHRHPYPELFIVHAGRADFEVDGARLIAEAGDIVIAPAHSAHRFTNGGNEQLRLTAIHPVPEMESEWLDPPRADQPDASSANAETS